MAYPGLLYPIEPGPRANHMAEADADLGLTPEERFLYNMHLTNLHGRGRLEQPDGSISSLIQMSFEGPGGKTYNIPTLWGGRQLPPHDAIREAEKVGLDKFPSYASGDEAEARYQAMHDYLARDTGDFLQPNQPTPAMRYWPPPGLLDGGL